MIRLVALDAVGTLIRLREPVGETYARLARAHGVALPPARLEDAFRRVLEQAPAMVFRGPEREPRERGWWRERVRACFRAADQMVRFADFDALFAELFAHYAGAGAWLAAPDAEASLAARRDGRRVVVASNFDYRLPRILDALGLSGFDAVLGPGDLGAAKPDPAFFEALARRFEVAPAQALYAGDDPRLDLEPARRAGWRAIDVASLATLGGLAERIAALDREEPPG